VFTPRDAPRAKLDPIAELGADLRAEADDYEHSERLAKAWAETGRAVFISPYSHPDIVAGAGTVAIEILEELPGTDMLVVPVGGGGLIAGVAVAAKGTNPDVEVVGVEAESSPAFNASLAAGRIVEVSVRPTIADGLAGNMDPESITFGIVQRLVDRTVLAPENMLAGAVRGLVSHEHLIAEGAGAAGVAALIAGRIDVAGREVAVVVSGGNIDARRLAALISDA
jgi:threonine dehydratase